MNMNLEKYLKLRYIYLLAIVYCLFLTYFYHVDISFDTPTYINAWSTLQECHIDKWRTPVYPVFLGIMNIIFGDYYLYYVVVIQHILFLISIRYFYLLMQSIITTNTISFLVTFFYALYPCVATYNCCIATETFAVTGSVFLLYSILNLYKTKQFHYGLYAFFWLFFLVFLRPAVVYLLPVTIVGWCFVALKRGKKYNKPVVYGLTGSIIVSVILVAYMSMFKASYGVFTPSGIGLINRYTIAKAANVIDLNETGEELGFYQEAEKYINMLGMEAFSDTLNQSINQNKGKFAKRLWQNMRKASRDNLFEPSYQVGIFGVVSDFMSPPIKIIYFILLIYGFIILRRMVRWKNITFFPCLLFMIGVSNFILIIIASPGEYGRLLLPALPAYFVMFAQLVDMIWAKRNYLCSEKK